MNKSAESRARQFGSETQMSYGLEKVSAGVNAVISTPSTSLRARIQEKSYAGREARGGQTECLI